MRLLLARTLWIGVVQVMRAHAPATIGVRDKDLPRWYVRTGVGMASLTLAQGAGLTAWIVTGRGLRPTRRLMLRIAM